jgi:hypothetical protein
VNAHKIITTTLVDDVGVTFTHGEKHGADVDLWQTNYPDSVIPTFMRVPGAKPLLVSEYGFPYAFNTGEGSEKQLEHVAQWLVQQIIAMEQNFNLTDSVGQQIVVGGFVFEYRDEMVEIWK